MRVHRPREQLPVLRTLATRQEPTVRRRRTPHRVTTGQLLVPRMLPLASPTMLLVHRSMPPPRAPAVTHRRATTAAMAAVSQAYQLLLLCLPRIRRRRRRRRHRPQLMLKRTTAAHEWGHNKLKRQQNQNRPRAS